MLKPGYQIQPQVTVEASDRPTDLALPFSLNAAVLAKNLKLLRPGASYALMVRHAERPNFSVLNFRGDTPITGKGLADSRHLGTELIGQRLTGVFSSPVLRCLQTSGGILEGAGLSLPVTTRKLLGEPGSYIVNPLLVFTYFLRADVPCVIRKFIARGSMNGFAPLREGSVRILNELLADLSRPGVRNLYVSHDAVLAPFISYFTGNKFGEDEWVDFLDGIFLTVDEDGVRLIWGGKEYLIERSLYA